MCSLVSDPGSPRCDVGAFLFGEGRNCHEPPTMDLDSLGPAVLPFMADRLGKSEVVACTEEAGKLSVGTATACFRRTDLDTSGTLLKSEFRLWVSCMNISLACHADLCA